ncbi:rab11 family-interacting protein 4B-like [Coccinella septempunctata]|uniref:rab11 family-interacting protein 4B-like n=1 Tax=Coccinella septempunctata TaxID=41139 RepID=UPI001D071373|nr:rab11 family-interacting protein 4B-like [Coccinella septempunctata]
MYKAIDDKMPAVCVFVDLAKAFDTVCHNELLLSLEGIGVRELEKQMRAVKESSVQNHEKYSKTQLDNFDLKQQIISLKQQIEEMESRNEERSQEENERWSELLEKIRREQRAISEYISKKISTCEANEGNLQIIIKTIEADQKRLTKEVEDLAKDVVSAKKTACSLKQQEKRLKQENNTKAKMIDEMIHEMGILKSQMKKHLSDTILDESPKLRELYTELCRLKEKNFLLEEANEDMKSSLLLAGLEHGQLLTHIKRVSADLTSMTKEEIHKALKEEQNNSKLLIYIDRILSKIVETYPQPLEAKQKTEDTLSK